MMAARVALRVREIDRMRVEDKPDMLRVRAELVERGDQERLLDRRSNERLTETEHNTRGGGVDVLLPRSKWPETFREGGVYGLTCDIGFVAHYVPATRVERNERGFKNEVEIPNKGRWFSEVYLVGVSLEEENEVKASSESTAPVSGRADKAHGGK